MYIFSFFDLLLSEIIRKSRVAHSRNWGIADLSHEMESVARAREFYGIYEFRYADIPRFIFIS